MIIILIFSECPSFTCGDGRSCGIRCDNTFDCYDRLDISYSRFIYIYILLHRYYNRHFLNYRTVIHFRSDELNCPTQPTPPDPYPTDVYLNIRVYPIEQEIEEGKIEIYISSQRLFIRQTKTS